MPVLALWLLVGCGRDDPLNEPAERYGMVEVDPARAVRLSVAEVTAGELVVLELQEPESDSPVWESWIVDQSGRIRTVRLGATRGEVLGGGAGPDLTETERQQLVRRLEETRILPDEAAREAADTGELVTAIRLDERNGDPVWNVHVLGVADETAVVHTVDARTGAVLARRSA